MKYLVIKQKRSLYNQQHICSEIRRCTKKDFSIKRRGKHVFSVYFEESFDSYVVEKLAKKLGLCVASESSTRCILSEDFSLHYN